MLDLPLRPYQDQAIDEALRRSSLLLALVQGAGKTRVAIEVIRTLAEEGSVVGGAIFCPSSLKFQWKDAELAKWDDSNLAIVIDGDKKKRTRQFEEARKYRYTILNYDSLVHDWALIQEYLPIDFIVADEVTYIKGFRAKRAQRLKQLARYTPYRYGLSGQPIENRPEELFSIMEFVDPTVLGPFDKFDPTFIVRDGFGRPRRYRNLRLMHQSLGDAMFRRSRDDIAQYLPDRVETESPVRLTPQQVGLYEYIRQDLVEVIDMALAAGAGGNWDMASHYGQSDGSESNMMKGTVMARITAMRLLCSHPSLLAASAANFDDPNTKTGSAYASELIERGLVPSGGSAKLDAMIAEIDLILMESPTNKVVVYSVFKPMVRMISLMLQAKKYGVVSMTGDTSPTARQDAIHAFNTKPETRAFVSSDAGAYGVNLDHGTHLICYDFPWSAGLLQQRVARIDRTSTEHGTIYIDYMYGAETIEQYQKDLLAQKALIAEAWIDGQHINDKGRLELDLGSLREFMAIPLSYV